MVTKVELKAQIKERADEVLDTVGLRLGAEAKMVGLASTMIYNSMYCAWQAGYAQARGAPADQVMDIMDDAAGGMIDYMISVTGLTEEQKHELAKFLHPIVDDFVRGIASLHGADE